MSAVADEVWAIRVPATLAAVATALLVSLVAREVGGGRFAQGLAAWGYAFAAFPLIFGHLTLTSAVDDLAWVALLLCIVRARLRPDPRYWLAVGGVAGLATYNKLLIAGLLLSLGVALLTLGPRRLPWRWVAGGLLVAALLALPTLIYQAATGWPQLTMSRTLSARHGGEVRVLLWPMLLILLGPFLVPVWVAGLVALWRRREWQPVRFLAGAFLVLLLLTAGSGGQFYYPLGLLCVLYAIGTVPVADWVSRVRPGRRRLVVAGVAVNSVVAAVIALPIIPLSVLGSTPLPGLNQAVPDQVGWPAYVQQVASVYASLSPAERHAASVVTSNYGEAGAIARFGAPLGLPPALSGQNELYFQARPPQQRSVLVVVGRGASAVAGRNAQCEVVTRLDNGVHVNNEEQDQPVSVCREAALPWSVVWPQFQHYD